MTMTAEQIAAKRGKEIFLVETVNTPYGKRWAIVSHKEHIGNEKRIIDMFPHTKADHEKAVAIARRFREDAAKASETADRAETQIERSETE